MLEKRKVFVSLLAVLMAIAFMPVLGGGTIYADVADFPQDGNITVAGDYTIPEAYTGTITVAKNLKVTLNLNSATIEGIVNHGDLTIQGNGTVNATESGKAAIGNTPGATCIVNGGIYKSSIWYTIKNLGKMTINEGVTINSGADANNSSLIDNGYYGDHDNDSIGGSYYDEGHYDPSNLVQLTINGGTFAGGTHSSSIVKNDDYGHLTIYDGDFMNNATEKDTSSTIMNWNEAVLYGGTYTDKANRPLVSNGSFSNAADQGILKINGGTYIAESMLLNGMDRSTYDTMNIEVNNGDFSGVKGTVMSDEMKKRFEGNNRSTKIVSGGTFATSPADYVKGGVAIASVTNGNTNTFAIGNKAIQKAAEDSSNTVTITNGGIDLTGVNANIKNDESNTGKVTVDGTKVEAGHSVQANASETIAKLKSQIAALEAQIQSAANTGNTASSKITRLENDLAKVQAELKEAQKQASEGKDVLTAPAQVQNLKAKAGKKRITLTWTAQTSNTTGYRVYRATKKNGKYTMVKLVKKAASVKWTNKGLKKGKRYFYKVRAYKSITNGTLVGGYSNIAKATVK